MKKGYLTEGEVADFCAQPFKKMKLRKGQGVVFEAINNFTGELENRKGWVVGDGAEYINKHPELKSEFGMVRKGEAFIIREGLCERGRLNLVTPEDILEIK